MLKKISQAIKRNEAIEMGNEDEENLILTKLRQIQNLLFLEDGILKRKINDQVCVVVPTHLKASVMKMFHDHIFSGHLAFEKTWSKIKSRFYWPQMHTDIKTWQYHPWQILMINIIGPFKTSKSGNKYVSSD